MKENGEKQKKLKIIAIVFSSAHATRITKVQNIYGAIIKLIIFIHGQERKSSMCTLG